MNAAAEAVLSERRMVAAGLRLSVAMLDQVEQALTGAAVELVVRARHGEFADPGWPWVCEGLASEPLGLFWLNADAMTAWNSGRPQHPVMHFVEALAGGRPVRRLRQLLNCLDEQSRRLVMTAFHHAAADRTDIAAYAFGGDPTRIFGRTPALLAWPPDELDQLDRPAPVLPVARPRLTLEAVR